MSWPPFMFAGAACRCMHDTLYTKSNLPMHMSRIGRVSSRSPSSSRNESTALHFYQNRQLELYASREAKRLTLRQLVFFGRAMDEDRLIKSANYVRTELPVRIAHRIRDLQTLPYVVVTQEGVARTYELYWSAFEQFRRYPLVVTMADNDAFCKFLSTILKEHATVIPSLSLGLSLSSPYLPPDQLDAFMRRMLVSRISRRVLAEHHIALSEIHATRRREGLTVTRAGVKSDKDEKEPHVGIIFTGLNVKRTIERCARLLRERPASIGDESDESEGKEMWPEVIIDGHLDTKFSYIREHLEYIVFELLKNSMHATKIMHRNSASLPPVRATIAAGVNDVGIRISDQGGGLWTPENQIKSPSDLFSFSHVRNASRLENSRLGALRTVSARPQGMWATVGEQVGRWRSLNPQSSNSPSPFPSPHLEHLDYASDSDSASSEIEAHASVGRIGIGLPMSNIFATYFGGSLELVSLDGYGTDVFLRVPKLGTNLEGIEL